MDDSSDPEILKMPPELAAAIVAAQTATGKLARDGSNTQNGYKYSTADEVAKVAKEALNKHGAAWVRIGVDLDGTTLGQFDLGRQAYVGDAIERWMIVHESGAALVGHARMPIIVSRARPHEKAVAASLTYDTGGILRGALCMEREDENAVDKRGDKDEGGDLSSHQAPRSQRPEQRQRQGGLKRDSIGPRCSGGSWLGELGRENARLITDIAHGTASGEGEVWDKLLTAAQIDLGTYVEAIGRPPRLTSELGKEDGQRFKKAGQQALMELSRG